MKNMLVMVSRVNLERPRSGVIIDKDYLVTRLSLKSRVEKGVLGTKLG